MQSLKGMTKSVLEIGRKTGTSVFDTGKQFLKRNLARTGATEKVEEEVQQETVIKTEKWILIFN